MSAAVILAPDGTVNVLKYKRFLNQIFWVYICVVLAAGGSVFLLSYLYAEQAHFEDWNQKHAFALTEQVNLMQHEVREVRNLLTTLVRTDTFSTLPFASSVDPKLNGLPPQLDQVKRTAFDHLMKLKPEISVLFVLTPNGDHYISHPYAVQQKLRNFNLSDRHYFHLARGTRQPTVSNSFPGADGRLAVVVLVPMISSDSTIQGYLGAVVPLENFARFTVASAIYPFDQGLLIDANNRLISSTLIPRVNIEDWQSQTSNLLLQHIEHAPPFTGQPGTVSLRGSYGYDSYLKSQMKFSEISFAGADYIAAVVNLEFGWRFVLLVDRARVHQQLIQQALDISATSVALLLALGLLGFALIHFIGRRWLSEDEQLRRTAASTEELLEETGSQFQAVLDNLPMALFLKDMEGRTRRINHVYAQWFGGTDLTAAGSSAADPINNHPQAHLAESRVLGAGEVVTTEFEYAAPEQGERVYYVIRFPILGSDRKVQGIGGIVLDSTELREVSVRLEEAELRYRVAAEAAHDGIVTVGRSGRILFANRAFCHLLGMPQDEVIAKRADELFESTVQLVEEPCQGAVVSAPQEMRLSSATGKPVVVEVSTGRWKVRNEAFATCIVRDVRERKRMESSLFHAQKMESVGHLTGGIAHDFNNLLQVILGNLEILSLKPLDDDARQHVERIRQAGLKGSVLVAQLLSYARKQILEPQVLELNQAISDVQALLMKSIGKEVNIMFRLAREKLPVEVDVALLESTLINLVINARDAMPNGGDIMISTELRRSTGSVNLAYAHPAIPEGDYAIMEVRDEGTGIPPEIQDRVFDPFFTTKEVGKGTGLGLSMVYGFIKQSGGFVEIDSQPDCGTTVRIILPLVSAQAGADVIRTKPARVG